MSQETVDIYRNAALNLTVTVDDTCVHRKALMGEDVLQLRVTSRSALDLEIGDYITHGGINYYLNAKPDVAKASGVSYEYSATFEADTYNLAKVQFLSIDGESEFSLMEDLDGFIDLIASNMQRVYGSDTWDRGTCDQTDQNVKLLYFKQENCLQVLQRLAVEFNGEFHFTGQNINFTDQLGSDIGQTLSYGRDEGLYSITRRTLDQENIVTRLYAFGSERNIANDYGAARLRLPVTKNLLTNPGFETGDFTGWSTWGTPDTRNVVATDPHDGSYCVEHVGDDVNEGSSQAITCLPSTTYTISIWCKRVTGSPRLMVMVDPDVYTSDTATGTAWERLSVTITTAAAQTTLTVWFGGLGVGYFDSVQIERGANTTDFYDGQVRYLENNTGYYGLIEHTELWDEAYPTRTGTVSSVNAGNELIFYDTSMDFDINDYLISGVTAKVHFQDGLCAGYQFELSAYDNGTQEFTLIAQNDRKDVTLPNSTLKPAPGDTYKIIDITMPESYVSTAEETLLALAVAYLSENCNPRVTYDIEIDPKFAEDAEVEELLTDGGFEAWSSPTNLTNWAESVSGTSTINQETVDVHSGSNALRLEVDSSNSNVYVYRSDEIDALTRNNCSVWHKDSDGGTMLVQIRTSEGTPRYLQDDGTWTASIAYRELDTAADWTKVDIPFTAPDWTGDYRILIGRNNAADCTLRIDDASIQRLGLEPDIGDKITVEDTALAVDALARVVGFERSLANQYRYRLLLSDQPARSFIQRLYDDARDLKSKAAVDAAGDIVRARANWRTAQELWNSIFDPDNYFTDKIRPLSIETTALSVGAKSMNFTLRNVRFTPNYGNDANSMAVTGGYLDHLSIPDGGASWTLQNNAFSSLTAGTTYYIYARCDKTNYTSANNKIVLDDEQLGVNDDPTYYYFLIGVLHPSDGTTRRISLQYGTTDINGYHVTTGEVNASLVAITGLTDNDISGLGDLATEDSADWSTQVGGSGKPDDNATVGATWGSNVAGVPSVLTDHITDGTPSTSGVYMTPNYIGFWDQGTTSWPVRIKNNGGTGEFFVGSIATSKYISWDGATMTVRGSLNADDITAGSITARTFRSAASGARIEMTAAENMIGWYNSDGSRIMYLDDGSKLGTMGLFMTDVYGSMQLNTNLLQMNGQNAGLTFTYGSNQISIGALAGSGNIDLTGNIYMDASKTVDGVDISAFYSAYGSHSHAFSAITSKPTTLAGYGITDACSDSELSTHAGTTGNQAHVPGVGSSGQYLNHTGAFATITWSQISKGTVFSGTRTWVDPNTADIHTAVTSSGLVQTWTLT